MNNKPKVLVLLSTYNGMKYLPEQLKSLQNQEGVDVDILVRDDKSTDGTVKYLTEYAKRCSNLSFYTGNNLKPCKSFLDLIEKAQKYEYYALCDQDDVWDSDKLFCAIKLIEKKQKKSIPILYFSNLRVVDQNLDIIRISHQKPLIQKNKYSVLVESLPTGCTMVFNDALMMLLKDRIPGYCSMHDTWIYMVCKFFGEVIYDFEPHISYRQHANNVIGTYKKKNFKFYYAKLKRMFDRKLQPRYQNAISFLDCYGDMLNPKDREKVCELVHYKDSIFAKMRLLLDKDIYATYKGRDFRIRILIICGLL